ncbi:MAG: hypothetical protein LBM69_07500 [Lachnospiraceae bacterium]|jgi:hypothetical protein|nr:hypothetical protein [Lachnospiraceae bacterium]
MGKEMLVSLLDNVDEKEYDTLYRVLLKFVKSVPPLPDEIDAFQRAKEEIARGEVLSHEEVWAGQ